MIEGLVFPDTRAALFDLIDGTDHYDPRTESTVSVAAFYMLPADNYGSLVGPFPVVHITPVGGTEGYVDRIDRVAVDVYAPGRTAAAVLESIRASVVGSDIETPSGYIDRIGVVTVPVEVPYQSDLVNKASATFEVTVRPFT